MVLTRAGNNTDINLSPTLLDTDSKTDNAEIPISVMNELKDLLTVTKANALQIPTYIPNKDSIRQWLKLYELAAARECISTQRMALTLPRYFDIPMSKWIYNLPIDTQQDWILLSTALIKRYGKNELQESREARTKLFALRQHKMSIRDYISEWENVHSELLKPLDSDEQIESFLGGLSPKTKNILYAFEFNTVELAMDAAIRLHERLIRNNEETEIKEEVNNIHSRNKFNKHHHQRKTGDSPNLYKKFSDIKCFYCGKEGHFKRDCRSRMKDTENRQLHKDKYKPIIKSKTMNSVNSINDHSQDGNAYSNNSEINLLSSLNNTSTICPMLTLSLKTVRNQLPIKVKALVDTGATITCLREDFAKLLLVDIDESKAISFKGAINTNTTKGTTQLLVYFGPLELSLSVHIIADLNHEMIIGYDTLKRFDVNVNASKSLIQIYKGRKAIALPLNAEFDIPTVANINNEIKHGELAESELKSLKKLLTCYESLQAKNPNAPSTSTIIEHRIKLEGKLPLPQSPRAFPPYKRQFIADSIQQMEDAGIISPSSSSTAAAVVPVKKKDGNLRLAIDYRGLNAITIRDAYPLPRVDTMLSILGRNRYFSTIDLASGFWQIPMHPEDRHLTAFVTEQGLFEFNVMPFGLCNAPATFQRLMDKVLKGIKWKICTVYIDDILIFSANFENHLKDLEEVFIRLKDANLSIKINKCNFARNQLPFLGYIATREGIKTDKSKVEAVKNWETPKSLTDVSSFLGLAGFYRHFIRNFSIIAEPLNRLKRNHQNFEWTEEQENSFQKIKTALITAPVLRYPDFTKIMEIHTDASTFGLGAVLAQRDESNKPYPISYSSRSLNDNEKKYGITELEALAVVWSVKKFRQYIEGSYFIIYTDHAALKWLMTIKDNSTRLTRWSLTLQAYNFDIIHKAGKSNQDADALSRQPHTENILALTGLDIRSLQNTDVECQNILKLFNNGKREDINMKNGIIYGNGRILLPECLRLDIIKENHDSPLGGHQGMTRTTTRIHKKFYWPKMDEDIHNYIKKCVICARTKSPRRKLYEQVDISDISKPFQRLAIDGYGPFTNSHEGMKYIIVAQDMFSRYVLGKATKSLNTEEMEIFLSEIALTTTGIPECIYSDNGPPFSSSKLQTYCIKLGINQKFAPMYHAESNGLVERFMAPLNTMIVSFTSDHQKDWDLYLQHVLFAYNTTPHTEIKETPYYLVFGRDPRLPTDIILNYNANYNTTSTEDIRNYKTKLTQNLIKAFAWIKQQNLQIKNKNATLLRSRTQPINFQIGDLVRLKKPTLSNKEKGISAKLVKIWVGPYRVIERDGAQFTLKSLNQQETLYRIHADRLKLAEEGLDVDVLEKEGEL